MSGSKGSGSGPTHPRWKKTGLLPGGKYAEVYELAKSGLDDKAIAYSIGISPPTLSRLRKRDPAVDNLLESGRALVGDRSGETFEQYLYGHLTNKLQRYWDEMMSFWKEDKKTAGDRVQMLLADAGRKTRQGLFVHAYVAAGFNASKACRLTCTPLSTFKVWVRDDPQFASIMREVQEHRKDFFDAAFVRLVKAGNPAAILHAAKTVNADRGYGTKIEVTGVVQHEHQLRVDELELDLETRKKLLKAYKKADKMLPEHDPDVIEAEVVAVREGKKKRRKTKHI